MDMNGFSRQPNIHGDMAQNKPQFGMTKLTKNVSLSYGTFLNYTDYTHSVKQAESGQFL